MFFFNIFFNRTNNLLGWGIYTSFTILVESGDSYDLVKQAPILGLSIVFLFVV